MSGCKLYPCLNRAKRDATVCLTVTNGFQSKRQGLPTPAVREPVLPAVKPLASFLPVASDHGKRS